MQTVALLPGGEEFDIGPVSGTFQGAPATLPGPVVFMLSGDPVIELTPIDAVTVMVKSLSAVGSASVNVSSGGLMDIVIVNVSQVADALVVPISPVRPIV